MRSLVALIGFAVCAEAQSLLFPLVPIGDELVPDTGVSEATPRSDWIVGIRSMWRTCRSIRSPAGIRPGSRSSRGTLRTSSKSVRR